MVYTPFVWLFLISTLMNGGLAYYTKRYADIPSAKPFRFMMWCAAIWAFLYGVNISLKELNLKLFTINLVYIPALLAAIACLALALEYTGRGKWLSRRKLFLLLIPVLGFTALALTSQSHQLWRYDYQLEWSGPVLVLAASRGIAYWVFVVYMLFLTLSAFFILLESLRYQTLYIRGTIVLSIGILIPILMGMLSVLGFTPIPGFDWTSTSFIWTGMLYIWAITRGGLFDVTPLARSTLVEYLEDPMIVLSKDGHISDFNRTAQNALALSPSKIGASPTSLSEPWNGIFQRHTETSSHKEEISIHNRTYELSITPIHTPPSGLMGRIFLFRDVSERKQAEEMERKQRNLAEALRDTAQALTSTLDFNSVLDQILKNVERVVPTDSANIALLDDEGIMHYVNFHGYEEHRISLEEIRSVSFSLDTSPIFKRIYETNEPYIISDTHSHPDWIIIPSGAWIRSYAGMPIRVRDKVIGFINLDSSTPGMYTPEHLDTLRAFANQIAIAVENARLYNALKTEVAEKKHVESKLLYQNKQLNALHQITLDLIGHHKLDELLDTILLRASELLESPIGMLGYIEEDVLVVKATTKLVEPQKGLHIPIKEARLSAKAIETRQPQTVDDYSIWEDRLHIHDPYNWRAVANIPILVNDKVVGVVGLGRNVPGRPYSEDEIDMMKSFAQLAALAIDNAQLFSAAQNEISEKIRAEDDLRNANQILLFQLEAIEKLRSELREQAIRDPLTGLYNRRYLAEILDREIARAKRENYPIGFVMIDIDHFKQINDTFGHDTGDAILQKLATMLINQTRIDDIICRYGGEEFLVILPDLTPEMTWQVTERWRISFMDVTLPLILKNRRISLSCGVAHYPIHGTNGEELIQLADKSLYQAKTAGRNQVVSWQPPTA